MNNLKGLEEKNFEHREWVALTWARQFMLYEGQFPEPNLVKEFTQLFSSQEQTDIIAAVKLIFFFNMLSNTIFKESVADTKTFETPSGDDKQFKHLN